MFGITHANVSGQVDELVLKLKARFPDMNDPMVSEVTPALGVHVGPGALCFSWIETSEHYESEKKGLRRWLP
jgi:fatty acid-binding protein DegV